MRFESQQPCDAIAAPIGHVRSGRRVLRKSRRRRGTGPTDTRTRVDADPLVVVGTDTVPPDFAGWCAWIASIVAELWSRIARGSEIRRIRVAA